MQVEDHELDPGEYLNIPAVGYGALPYSIAFVDGQVGFILIAIREDNM
jgi:hypothetical protein